MEGGREGGWEGGAGLFGVSKVHMELLGEVSGGRVGGWDGSDHLGCQRFIIMELLGEVRGGRGRERGRWGCREGERGAGLLGGSKVHNYGVIGRGEGRREGGREGGMERPFGVSKVHMGVRNGGRVGGCMDWDNMGMHNGIQCARLSGG